MGCDIHFYVERKADGKWQEVRFDTWYATYDNEKRWPITQAYVSRWYDLFARLANVRNYGVRVESISDPRGLPGDTSETVLAEYESWGADAHSASYYTLTELLAQDWSDYGGEWQGALARMRGVDANTDNVRAVFWFDN